MLVAGDLTTGLDAFYIALPTGTVLIEEQLRGSCLSHGLKHLLERIAAVEEQQQHGYISLSWILHFKAFSVQRYIKNTDYKDYKDSFSGKTIKNP
jgi:hypothetical protein